MKTLTSLLTQNQKIEIKKILKSLKKSTIINNYYWYTSVEAMGSGGIGQIRFLKKIMQIRIQTSYGKGQWNYADVIIIQI